MFYFGRTGRVVDGHATEPCMVNPDLPVRWVEPGQGESLGVSYVDLGAGGRGEYLSWLAGGREHPAVSTGHLLLFLYGLERRVLFDLGTDNVNCSETVEIVRETERLLDMYADHAVFVHHAVRFLEFVGAARAAQQPAPWKTSGAVIVEPKRATGAIRVTIGRYAAAGFGVPAEWFSLLYHAYADTWVSNTIGDCRSEFDRLFEVRYRREHPEGLAVRGAVRKFEMVYKPVSPSFGHAVLDLSYDLPDVLSDRAVTDSVWELASSCVTDLHGYSEHLRKHPGSGRGGLTADVYLPSDYPHRSELESWGSRLGTVLGDERRAVMRFDDLVERWVASAGGWKRSDVTVLTIALRRVGMGLEPDPRFGIGPPKPGTDVVLFRLDDPEDRFQGWASVLPLAHLAGVVTAGEETRVWNTRGCLRAVARELGLSPDRVERFLARYDLVAGRRPSMVGTKQQVQLLPDTDAWRREVGEFLWGVATVEDEPTVPFLRVFERLCVDYLGWSTGEVRSLTRPEPERERDLDVDGEVAVAEIPPEVDGPPDVPDYQPVVEVEKNRTGGSVDGEPEGETGVLDVEPDVESHVLHAGTGTGGFPSETGRLSDVEPESEGSVSLVLDERKVQAIIAATEQVAGLLDDVFAEDEHEPVPEPEPAGDAVGLWDLDGAHSSLVAEVIKREEWTREELSTAASVLGLRFLDSAVDVINDAALEMCDEPLLEGEGPYEVNVYAIEELFP